MGEDPRSQYERDLGVIEAITQVTRSCPNGAVVAAAERALAAIQADGRDALRTQAYFVLIAIKGWRGGRAEQVHRSLSRFLERPESETPATESSAPSSTPSSNPPPTARS